ncbi:hypothetical protein RRG08_034667 [Elysia crispata]|uniref:Uncharacterized protein n=1 Tax=Elysia crispata TaxID=231223 RepID=A0AAE0Z0Y5_9GAST|nr:hypothetical protein RRG08_034667 [Elysia crispata]
MGVVKLEEKQGVPPQSISLNPASQRNQRDTYFTLTERTIDTPGSYVRSRLDRFFPHSGREALDPELHLGTYTKSYSNSVCCK